MTMTTSTEEETSFLNVKAVIVIVTGHGQKDSKSKTI